jgi:[glutamine synthetase] adenylyltransferase / [glutamine synthetase]-adenylyl-L-tyrosine phosphorylase
MHSAFTGVAFAQPASAETTLAEIEKLLPAQLWGPLPGLLAQLPDPDGALNYLERYLQPQTADGAERPVADVLPLLARRPTALHHLLVIFSYSRFLSETLLQQPELILWVDRPSATGHGSLDRIKSPEDLHAEFARFAATSFELTPALALARFKKREYVRITLRDVLGLATLAETTVELSQLADVLLEHALRLAEQKLEVAFGSPEYVDSDGKKKGARLAVLSLGKLGGMELNYSSDVDLMFVYGHDGATSGGREGTTTNLDYFVRVSQGVLKTITEMTPEGAVFRVDLRLRPQGREGNLATSVASALEYYRTTAREWELQMLIKARGSAGDATAAREFLNEVQPLIYKREFNVAAVEAVLNAREEITRDLKRAAPTLHAAEWNVKLSPGGIRDIEFLTQCLQRLYGGSEKWLHSGSTLVALQRLHDKGHLTGREFFRLAETYQFLRKVEHRLQLRDGLQTHTIPESLEALDRLARRCGIEPSAGAGGTPADELLHRLGKCFADVREIYERMISKKTPEPSAPREQFEADAGAGQLMRRLQSGYPRIGKYFAEVGGGKDNFARRGLTHYLSSAALVPGLLGQLEMKTELLSSATELFARSDYAAECLTRHPQEISIVGESEPTGRELKKIVAEIGKRGAEQAMSDVRISYRKSAFRALAAAIRGPAAPFETFAALSSLAEEAIAATLVVAAHEVLPADLLGGLQTDGSATGAKLPLTVLALGRLGTAEMDFGSDADLVFVADESLGAAEREPWSRFAERLSTLAANQTRDGLLFPVDTRLRPRGTQGEMLPSAAYLLDYFRNEAAAWEAATYLKARPVAGNLELGWRVVSQVQEISRERFADPSRTATELAGTREKLETEGTTWERGRPPKSEFKKMSGGFYDIEYILAFLFLTGGLGKSVAPGSHVLRQIAALESAGSGAAGLTTTTAGALRAAALFYRSVDHAVRIVTGHAVKGEPEPGLAERVTSLLKVWGMDLRGGVSEELVAMRIQTRALYERLVRGRK